MKNSDFLAALENVRRRVKGFAITPWSQRWIETVGDSNSVSCPTLDVRSVFTYINQGARPPSSYIDMGVYQTVVEIVWTNEMLGLALPEVYTLNIGKHIIFLIIAEVITITLLIPGYTHNIFCLGHP